MSKKFVSVIVSVPVPPVIIVAASNEPWSRAVTVKSTLAPVAPPLTISSAFTRSVAPSLTVVS